MIQLISAAYSPSIVISWERGRECIESGQTTADEMFDLRTYFAFGPLKKQNKWFEPIAHVTITLWLSGKVSLENIHTRPLNIVMRVPMYPDHLIVKSYYALMYC